MRKPFVYKSLNSYSKCLLKNFSLRFLCTVGRLPLFKRRTISCFTFVVVSFSGYKCLSVLFVSTCTLSCGVSIRYYFRFALCRYRFLFRQCNLFQILVVHFRSMFYECHYFVSFSFHIKNI